MNYCEMMVTPELAKEWLSKNSVNRGINKYRAKQYAYDMETGRWQLNGEAIKIYEDGTLADGQHRLTAIVMYGKAVKMCVITGVPKDISVQDRGRVRNTTDSMIIEGFPRELANNRNVALAKLHYAVTTNGTHNNVSDGMVKDFLLRNEENVLSVQMVAGGHCGRTEGRIHLSTPVKLAMFYALNSKSCQISEIKAFADVLRTGIPTSLNQSAAIVCRNDLMSKAIDAHGGTTKRITATFQVEKALFDFLNEYPRKISYAKWSTPIYSCMDVNKGA